MSRDWSEAEVAYLKEVYPTTLPSEEIARHLGRPLKGIYGKAKQLNLHRPKEIAALYGRLNSSHPNSVRSRFQKGEQSWNKGKKLSAEVYAKVSQTMFKKGHVPVTIRPIGSERVNRDGYIEIKVAEPNKWRLKHRVVWEEANGKIPKGYNIQFKNHNSQDCRLDNLYIISREEQMRSENSFYARYPKEMQEVIHLKGCINRQIHKIQKKNQDE